MGIIGPATQAGYRRWLARRYPDALGDDAEQVLLGSLLGDGCLMIAKPNKLPFYSESHSAAQTDYVQWKAEVLKPLGASISKRLPNGMHLRTLCVPFLADYRAMFYPQGRKILPEAALAQLGPLGLAVWFMDDGSINHHLRNAALGTDCFSVAQQQHLCSWFAQRWGLHPVLQFQKTKSAYNLRFRVDDATALIRLLTPHLHPLFRAKWRVDDPNRWSPAITKSQASMLGNAVRTARIKAGQLTVGYHTGTIRLTNGQPPP